jgi:zinc transporter
VKTHSFPSARRPGEGAPPLQWLVLDGRDPADRAWIASQSGFDESIKEAVTQSPVRNDRVRVGAAIVLALVRIGNAERGKHEGMEIVVEPHRIVTVCYGTDAIVEEALARHADNASPMGTGHALSLLVAALVKPLESEVTRLSDRVGDLEDAAMKEGDDGGMDDSVVLVGREVLALRRYLAPMHDELSYLALNPDELPGQADPRHLRRAADSLARLVSALDSSHSRVLLVLSQLRNRDSDRDSRAMHNLTTIATVFLPLSFVTGLLGINVAGIPDSHNPYAFWAVCGFLVAVAVGAIALIRWRRWM